MFTLEALSFDACPLGEGGQPKGRGWIRLEEAGAAKQLKELKSPVFPSTRKILGLIVAVAILDCILMKHAATSVGKCR